MEQVVTPPALSIDALASAIAQYRAQHDQITQQLQILDQQRVMAVKTQDTLIGAIAALEQVIQNVKDEQDHIVQRQMDLNHIAITAEAVSTNDETGHYGATHQE